MNDQDQAMLSDMSRRLFTEQCDVDTLAAVDLGGWPAALWSQLEETGLLAMLMDEDAGGIAAPPSVFAAIMRIAGRFGAPGPIAETMIARQIIAKAGGDVPEGPLLIAAEPSRPLHVRFAPGAHIVVLLADAIHILPPQALADAERSTNMAGEEFAAVAHDPATDEGVRLACPADAIDQARQLLSLARGALILGACERIMDMSLGYVGDRVQFGRPIGKFQAVQQQLAALAGAVAAGSAILSAAARATDTGSGELLLHAARVRLADTVDEVAAISHQVHGAIGFTKEYALQLFTRRIWAWRNEATDLGAAAQAIAASCAGTSADTLWHRLVALTAPTA